MTNIYYAAMLGPQEDCMQHEYVMPPPSPCDSMFSACFDPVFSNVSVSDMCRRFVEFHCCNGMPVSASSLKEWVEPCIIMSKPCIIMSKAPSGNHILCGLLGERFISRFLHSAKKQGI